MTTIDPRVEAALRRMFKHFNPFMIWHWRLGIPGWVNAYPPITGRIMVLTHIGRKSGKRRRTPVNYAIVDGEIYCTAGFGSISDWYRNISINPAVEIWLPDSWWEGVAEEVTEPTMRLPIMRQVLIGSGLAAFLVGINPYTISNADLDAATTEYRLIHIRRTAARTGPDGPGDLSWIWPVATIVLLLALLRRGCS